MNNTIDIAKPNTIQGNLAKLPKALAPLIERPQWAVWRWTQRDNGTWQKPPFQAKQPDRHASTNDSATWTDYPTALAAVQARHGDGLSYVLTKDDRFGAIDLDHCRDKLCSIDVWAQNFMQYAVDTYQEVTPSGEGVRIWGLVDADPLNRKFTLEIGGKQIAAELFRKTNKALTITGYTLNPSIRELRNIDKVFDWAVVWGERRKAAAAAEQTTSKGNGFDTGGCKYTIDEIERIVREGVAAGGNRSDVFHAIVGHYAGVGWDVEQICEHLQQHPDGIGSRYIAEDRLRREIERSAEKFGKAELPLFNGWEAKAPPEPEKDSPREEPKPDEADADLDDDDLDDADLDNVGEEDDQRDPELPRLYAHGETDAGLAKSWLIKKLMPAVGHGLLSGQWGSGKTFAFFDLAAAVMTGQPFLNHTIKRQCGVLLIAAEGADEVRLRLDAVVREKCGNMSRAPFRWYTQAPALLDKGSAKMLIEMARQAEAPLMDEFGLPLGLIGIDTIAACAGYRRAGDENDNAVGQALMNVLKAVAREIGCFVLGIDHFGKDLQAGTSGAGSKEGSGDLVLACLGERQVSGSVSNTRLAVRKHRGGQQGMEYPFALRKVEAPEKDQDGEAIETMVIDWSPPGTAPEPSSPEDPWAKPKRQDQRTAALRLKRVLMAILAEQGVDLPIAPDGPVLRMVDQKLVRKAFYACTPADGTPEQKGRFRRQKFLAALDWAEQAQLIGAGEVEGVSYLWLAQPKGEDEGELD